MNTSARQAALHKAKTGEFLCSNHASDITAMRLRVVPIETFHTSNLPYRIILVLCYIQRCKTFLQTTHQLTVIVLVPLGSLVPLANASVTMNIFASKLPRRYPNLLQASNWLAVLIVPLTEPTFFSASLRTEKYWVKVLVPSIDGLFTRWAV